MIKHVLPLFLLTFLCFNSIGQPQAIVFEGEFGITAGGAHYFGDLNNRAALNRPKPAIGMFYRKQVGDYIGIRAGVHYAQLGYSDTYSKNDYQRNRNLSFNTDIWEFALQGDFNFFRFIPGSNNYFFTPYITLGIGTFNFNPYAYYNNQKYFLQPLATEGQGSSVHENIEPYKTSATCFPVGMGVKYSVNPYINLSFEAAYRFTSTDYLDDVSTTYAGPDAFPNVNGQPSIAFLLQDRSYETGNVLGIAGKQRGFSQQKDQYLFVELGISFTITSYKCPSAR
jgi:hypothetical protein